MSLCRKTTAFSLLLALTGGMACRANEQDSRSPSNLLPNPSFEETATGGVPGWRSRAWNGEASAAWRVESPGRSGGRCLSIGSEKGADAAWTATVAVEPDTYYRLSGWIRTQEVRGAAGALLNIQNLRQVKTEAVSGTRPWTQVGTVFETGESTQLETNCLFGGWGSSTGKAWYDDVALEKVDAPPEETKAVARIDAGAPSVRYTWSSTAS